MPYVIRKTNGTNLLIIDDGYVDTSTGLNLVGRGFSGYGEQIADNFIRLLENFANSAAPVNPLEGQLWFDTTDNSLKYRSNSAWKTVTESSTTIRRKNTAPPTSKGQAGDTEGCVAIDGNYFYYCVGTYNGVTDIWKRIAWTSGTW